MLSKITRCLNGDLKVGDLVLSVPDNEYSCLVGVVTEINLRGTPEQVTDNESDDVHVNFMQDYSEKRIAEIEELFSGAYGDDRPFDELPLDEVIMAPDGLIRITGFDEDMLSLLFG